jgi:LAS superfamily LD-carboxypeptidase LdcB
MLKSGDRRSITATTHDGECEPHPAPHPGDQTLTLASVRGITVHTSIATQLDALLVAAEADGLNLTGMGYRSHQRQIELRRAHCGSSRYAIYEAPASTCSPPTARPGTSMHERGLAIDFDNCSTHTTACWRWLNNSAAHYGLYNLPSEPWHWSTNGQ